MSQENKVELRSTLLEVTRDKPYEIEGKKGKSAALIVRFGGKLIKLKAQNDNTDMLDEAQNLLDSDVVVVCEVIASQGMVAALRAIEVRAVE